MRSNGLTVFVFLIAVTIVILSAALVLANMKAVPTTAETGYVHLFVSSDIAGEDASEEVSGELYDIYKQDRLTLKIEHKAPEKGHEKYYPDYKYNLYQKGLGKLNC